MISADTVTEATPSINDLEDDVSHVSDWTSTFLRRVKKKLPKAFPLSHRVAAAVRLHRVVLTVATTTLLHITLLLLKMLNNIPMQKLFQISLLF